MWKVILLCTFMGLTTGEKVSYEDHKLYYVRPKTQMQLRVLNDWYYDDRHIMNFWTLPSKVNEIVQIMVPPIYQEYFIFVMEMYKFDYIPSFFEIQTLMDMTMRGTFPFFNKYHTLRGIYAYLKRLASFYRDEVQLIEGGQTYEGRDIIGVNLSFKPNNTAVFLEGGTDARQWLPPAVVVYILHELLTNDNPEIREIAESFDWYIFPTFNPDGYVYSHTTDRLWKKNRKPYGDCVGVDLNKNWIYTWKYKDSQEFNICSDGYSGPYPFSEIETMTISKFIEIIQDKLFGYFSYHSNRVDITYPSSLHVDFDDDIQYSSDMYDIAKMGEDYAFHQISEKYPYLKRYYTRKNIIETSDDVTIINSIKGMYEIPVVFSYGIKAQSSTFNFLEPPEFITIFGNEAFYTLIGMLKEAKRRLLPHARKSHLLDTSI